MQAILIHPLDNVALALKNLSAGTHIHLSQYNIVLKEDIIKGHKFALKSILKQESIIKYGATIAYAQKDIKVGEHVHNHNIISTLKSTNEYVYNRIPNINLKGVEATFLGYQRSNNEVGIRNEVWIIPTVFCVNKIAQVLERYGQSLLHQFPNVDNCVALTHPYGCSQMGDDELNTQKILSLFASHPNCGGVLILGLGCENNNIKVFKAFLDPKIENIAFLNTQEVEDELELGYSLIEDLMSKANQYTRSPCALSKIKIGLKCGGSDGLSGVSANPLIGHISDLIVGSQGTTIMSEVPEMFGAEQLLMNRAQDEEVFKKLVNLINNFKQYFILHHQAVNENPSPGNKLGGISTLEDKSLGCVQKGGRAYIVDVLDYGQKVSKIGFNLVCSPGNDGVSSTALAASGAHMILFSTGRGTPFSPIVPTIKIATNSDIYQRKNNWLDFNAGRLINGESMDLLVDELLHLIIKVASGQKTKAELNGYKEMVIWKNGVTM